MTVMEKTKQPEDFFLKEKKKKKDKTNLYFQSNPNLKIV